MQAVALAAGEGTRLYPLTDDKPKPLVELDGRPLLGYVLDRLVELDPEEIVVVVGYRGEQVVERFGDTYRRVPLTYAWQDERRGMAHALLCAREHLDGDVAVADGDCVIGAALQPVIERHHRAGVDGTTLVYRAPPEEVAAKARCDVTDEGRAGDGVSDDGRRAADDVTDDSRVADDGRLVGIEKEPDPQPGFVAGGFHTFPPSIFEACERIEPSERGELELADAMQVLVDEGQTINVVECPDWHVNVNAPADLERAERLLDERGFDGEGSHALLDTPEEFPE